MLEPGAPAPAFSLPDQDGKLVSLQDLRGRWVVLYFYPKDDTPGCTVEACEFTGAKQAFAGLDAVVFGCSADGAAAHQKFIAKHGLGISLLTDTDHKVMQSYGAYGKKVLYGKSTLGVIRSSVIIAPDGRLAHRWASVQAAGHAEHVRARLADLQGLAVVAMKSPAKKAKKAKKAKPAKAKTAKPAAAAKPTSKKAAAKRGRGAKGK